MSVSVSKLVKMGEEITLNMSYTSDDEVVANRVADHLQRFWDPRMKAVITEYANDENSVLTDCFRLAITKI